MAKIKLTKGELKKQRDALKQFERYLPTLQLKKQQLQLEILHQLGLLDEKKLQLLKKQNHIESWIGLLRDPVADIKPYLLAGELVTENRNIAGTDIPIFIRLEFSPAQYDLFLAPLWVDAAIENLRLYAAARAEIKIIEKGVFILKHELRVTSQRVNLFEKVKIPQAQEDIRLIKVYIGDQLANAVGRSKIAKRKIEEQILEAAE